MNNCPCYEVVKCFLHLLFEFVNSNTFVSSAGDLGGMQSHNNRINGKDKNKKSP